MKRTIGVAIALTLASGPALSADRKIKPLPADQCRALVEAVSKAVNIPLSIRTGPPDWPPGLSGDACLASGKATGISIEFYVGQTRLERAIAGWTSVLDYDAYGPTGAVRGFTKGPGTFIYSLGTEPPAGTCEHIPVGDCKVPLRQWHWTLKVTAFVE